MTTLTILLLSALSSFICHAYQPTSASKPFIPQDLNVNTSAPRPNILIFLIDDMGYSDLASYGSPNVSTPHIDALIKSGMKFKQWVSAAPICTPSRASLQTGRYPIRTGCMGNVEKYRVVPTPSNPGGLDPSKHVSIATALKQGGYRTGMSGKWHLGINGNKPFHNQDRAFTPSSHSYDSYLGAPYTNAPMCEVDGDGISRKHHAGQTFCFMMANDTVVQQPLHLVNFTSAITNHAIDFIGSQSLEQPWFFFMSYFHVHTPLFTARQNQGRSRGGKFGDNIEELDDSVGDIMTALRRFHFDNNTLVFLTSDNGPYQEEGWTKSGRTNVYDESGKHLGRLRGGKGQVFEGGLRMPGAVIWPEIVKAGSVSHTMVSTMDIFPTALAVAGVDLGKDYVIDGRDMGPVIRAESNTTQHQAFLHYCGFNPIAARVEGRFKVFWSVQKWYTNDAYNASICTECCNGINPASYLVAPATELCGCTEADMTQLTDPIVYDMLLDPFESKPLTADNWPADARLSRDEVLATAKAERDRMQKEVHPKPDSQGAGTCTAGLPAAARQPCCPGCRQAIPFFGKCRDALGFGSECHCNVVNA